MTASEPEANPHAGATPGYAGYEYQILVTVWLALDLMLDQSLADSITVEPASQEDIEAELRVPRDSAESICYAGVPSGRLVVQIKSRGTGPWSARDFAKIISEPVTQSTSSTRRARPLEVLKQDDHALFLFVTNAAVEGALLPYRVDKPSGSHNSEELPPHVRSIGDSVSGKRVRVIDGLTEEVITIRIQSILQRRGHVPSTELGGCIERLMSTVRSRLLGRVNRKWALSDIEAVLRSSAGLPEATEDISSYVEPLCYPEIQRKLQQSNVVVLIGTPGTGKTLTGRKLALDHQRDQTPYTDVNETAGPSAIFTCLQKADRYLFFLNDPWGASEVESGAARWNQELRRLLAQASPDKRFVITSRSDVVRSAAGASVSTYDQFVVAIVDSYDGPRRLKILEAKIRLLPDSKRDFAQRNGPYIIGRLESPLAISVFARLLKGQLPAIDNDTLDKLIHDSQLEAISYTVEQQVKGWPHKAFACSAIMWALLRGNRTVKKDSIAAIRQQLALSGETFEIDRFVLHLESGAGFEQRKDVIEAHPKVIEGLELVVREHPAEAGHAIAVLLETLGELYSRYPSSEWGKMLFATATYVKADNELSSVVRGNIKETVNEFLRNRINVSDGHAFGELIRDISEWGLLDPTIDALVNVLTAGDKEGVGVFEIWRAPELPATIVDQISHSALAQTIFHKFIRNVLPQTQKKYGRSGFLSFAAQFGLTLSSDFRAALDFLLDAEVLSLNSDLILHGALLNEDAFLDSILDRILALRNIAEKRFADLVPDLDRARESELDVIQCDRAEDEAGDCLAVADDLLREYVKARRSLQGFAFLCRFDSGSPVFSTWSRVLLEYDAAPSADEVTTFVERSEKIRERRWEVIAKHQRRDLADRFISDLCNSDAEVRRQCLNSLEGVIPAEDLPGKISSALLSCDWSRILEVYTDILRIESLRENAANIKAAIIASRSTNDSSLLDAIELTVHGASTEDLHKRCSAVSIGEIEIAARRMDGVAKGYMLRILAAAGGNVVPLIGSAITSGSEELVGSALDALDDQRSQDAIDQIRKALGHRSYRIRRHAMLYLAKSGTESNQQGIINMATDRSAPVREACARIIGDKLRMDGLPTLVKLLGDKRDYENSYDSWPKYKVARTAATSLKQFENPPQETIRALVDFVDGGRDSSDDVVVHAMIMYALAQTRQDQMLSRLISGLRNPWHIGREGDIRYPIRIVSARGLAQMLLDPTNILLREPEAKELIRAAFGSDVRVSAPALMASAFRSDTTLPFFEEVLQQDQTPLLRIVLYVLAAAAGRHPVPDDALNRILPNPHPIYEILGWDSQQAPASPSPDVLEWIMTLKASRPAERAILYLLSRNWKAAIEQAPDFPWDDDNLEPKEIPTMTLRSMFGGE